MTEEQRIKYEVLKNKNRNLIKTQAYKNNVLFMECMEKLKKCEIISLEQTEQIFKNFEANYPISKAGVIEWKLFDGNIEKCVNITSSSFFENYKDEKFWILWDTNDIPCIECLLSNIVCCLEDITAVSFNTWLISKDIKNIVEFHHEGTITIGSKV